MLGLTSSVRIYVARKPVDFRKAHDGLLAIVRDSFQDDPFDGSLFVFLNRRRDRVKILQWDRDGLWLHYKRLETGTFQLRLPGEGDRVEISRPEFHMLLEGIDFERKRIRPAFTLKGRGGAMRRRDDGSTQELAG